MPHEYEGPSTPRTTRNLVSPLVIETGNRSVLGDDITDDGSASYRTSTLPDEDNYSSSVLTPSASAWWIPDEAATSCSACDKKFWNLVNRKHHCRSCGGIFCSNCTKHKALINGKKAKVCLMCYTSIKKQQAALQPPGTPSVRGKYGGKTHRF